MSERTRAYVYRVASAAVPLLVFYGVVDDSAAALWLGLVGAVLGSSTNALASRNTSTRSR